MSDIATLAAARAPTGGRSRLETLGRLGEAPRFLDQPALRRALPLIVALAAIAIALVAIFALRQPSRVPIFPGLAEGDKAAVMAALSTGGFDAAIDPDTGAVAVPQRDLYRARAALAGQGLPKAVPGGYDLLTELPMGASRALERARMKQAQEGELGRSIEAIGGIASARVMLATPDPTPFVRETAPPSASVFVALQPGRALGEPQVRAIQHLVATAVPGLAIARVSVVDGMGQLLSPDADAGDTAESQRQLAYQTRLERGLRERVQALLGPVVGTDNFTAQVHADLDFTETSQTSERFPGNSALRSEQSAVRADSTPAARGIPGAISNTAPPAPTVSGTPPAGAPAASAIPAPPTAGQNREESFTKNYELGRDVSVTKPAPGTIRKLMVAVVLRDGAAAGTAAPNPQALERLIASAVGIDRARGDIVTVIRQPFAAPPVIAEAPMWKTLAADYSGHLIALLGIVAAVFVLRPLVRRARPPVDAPAAPLLAADGSPAVAGDADAPPQLEAPDPELVEQLARARIGNTADILSAANSYDDKVAAIRIFVGEDAARASSVLKQLLRQPGAQA